MCWRERSRRRHFAVAQAEATKLAQRARIDRAKAGAVQPVPPRKPNYTRKQFEMARALLGQERVSVGAIASVGRRSIGSRTIRQRRKPRLQRGGL
jgi:hypothetical protein